MSSDLIWQGLGGTVGAAVMFWVFKTWASRIESRIEARALNNDLEKKADVELCKLTHKQLDIDMRKGDLRFERIETKLDKLGDASQSTHSQLERILDAVIK